MKIIFLLSTLVLLAVCTSCNKENVIKNNGIYGKWQYKEVYDGYFNGGNFTWTKITTDNSHTREFKNNGQFIQKEDKNGDYRVCTGNFQYQTDSLYINSNCISTMQVNFVSELTATTLIIDQPVDEGVIRLKYVAIK
ncbi:MAG: hypothetical protein IPO46_09270 [Chitinophagaceae bacterium]|jgi:hypothetical protein|nr:hypothetical protein [Chitinophagaceae bacterium]MBP6046059.1 hypothetical protein [Ferruginibacter sp.]MBK7734985.1 hypothetical protein [Chitinophagaceae bacterium]MBK8930117.1 hypothetical protein [Chitinophagaceae bacterium]MBP6987053.1 hypothetical protein [Ferruginibacter sp.]